jgi:hypothetical protein
VLASKRRDQNACAWSQGTQPAEFTYLERPTTARRELDPIRDVHSEAIGGLSADQNAMLGRVRGKADLARFSSE